MKIIVDRFQFTEQSTISTLTTGDFHCYVLEDCDRQLEEGGQKIKGKTAIPRGTYQIVIDYSPRFNRDLPRLLDVPQYEGVRIHPGNDADDTEGCLLPGSSYSDDWVGNSRATFNQLFELMEHAYDKGEEIWIEVK